jgi:hypothetical protein
MISPRAAKEQRLGASIFTGQPSNRSNGVIERDQLGQKIWVWPAQSSDALRRTWPGDFASRMLVSQVKQRNMSKSARSSRDFAACIAIRQTGQ